MTKSFAISVNEQTSWGRIVEIGEKGFSAFVENSLRWIAANWIMIVTGLAVLIALLILIILLDRKDDRELAQFTQ